MEKVIKRLLRDFGPRNERFGRSVSQCRFNMDFFVLEDCKGAFRIFIGRWEAPIFIISTRLMGGYALCSSDKGGAILKRHREIFRTVNFLTYPIITPPGQTTRLPKLCQVFGLCDKQLQSQLMLFKKQLFQAVTASVRGEKALDKCLVAGSPVKTKYIAGLAGCQGWRNVKQI